MEIIKPTSCFSKTSSLADIAFRSVSGIRFAESSASPSDMLAPAILMDRLIVSLSINESLDRSSFTKRSQRPSEAVSSITSHLWARALSPQNSQHHRLAGPSRTRNQHNSPRCAHAIVKPLIEVSNDSFTSDQQWRLPTGGRFERIHSSIHHTQHTSPFFVCTIRYATEIKNIKNIEKRARPSSPHGHPAFVTQIAPR